MPHLRFSRDKRGYEHFYLVQPVANRRGKPSEHRILYWYRSPPNVKVGREPFDEETQRLVEAQNPGVEFDWEKFRNTPFPPPQQQPEYWRERRQAAKAARRLQREETDVDADAAAASEEAAAEQAVAGEEPVMDEEAAVGENTALGEAGLPDPGIGDAIASAAVDVPAVIMAPPTATEAAPAVPGQRRRRRRRRGRRGRTPENAPPSGTPQTERAPISSLEPDEFSGGASSSDDPDVPDGE